MYKIREARDEDYSFILQLIQGENNMQLGVNDSILDKNFFLDSLQSTDAKWFLVEQSGVVKAFMYFMVERSRQIVQIERFVIEADYKKKGLNEHLYKKVEQFSERQQMHVMQVKIADNKDDVIDFFERKGWVKESSFYTKYLN